MTDTINPTPETNTPVETDTQPAVTHTSKKPYDDELLDAYEQEHEAAEEALKSEAKKDGPKTEEPPAKELASPESEEKETKEAPEEKAPEPPTNIEDTALKRLINGKEVEFKIKDAVQAYVKQEEFNRNMDRRISQVAQREQRWTQDQNQFKDKIFKLMDVAQNGDFVTAIRALAKIAVNGSGSEVVEFEKKYFEQLDKVRDVYTKMTPEQREAYFAKRRATEAERKAKELEEEKQTHVERSQLQERVTQLQREHGLSEQEFWSNYQALVGAQVGEGKIFKTADEIEPEDVVRFAVAVRHEEKVLEAGRQLGIEDDAILDEVSRITASEPSFTVEDVKKVIEASGLAKKASPSVVENLNRKAQKSGVQFNQASSTKKGNEKTEGYDKETIEFLYRNQPRVAVRPQR